jgi:trigger factor
MKTEIIDVSPTRKEIIIEIEPNVVRGIFEDISNRYAAMATVPGFRKGHAPVSVVRSRFKKEIHGEVLQKIVPDAVQNAIEESKLTVIGQPEVHLDDAESLVGKLGVAPVTIHVHVEVMPVVTLGEYKGLEATRFIRNVSEADIDQVIDGLREAAAALQPVEDRPAQLGDTVTASFRGKFVDDPEAEDINVEEVDVVLGGIGVQQEFTENLVGANVDDERQFSVEYPEDFTSKGLAGKKVDYTSKVSAVRIKELPELDDEWASSLGDEITSFADLRRSIRQDMEVRSKAESDGMLRTQVLQKLVDLHQFEVPLTLANQQASERLKSHVQGMMQQGVDPRTQQFDWEALRESLLAQAIFDVRAAMLFDHIADVENIEVTEDEINAEINGIAEASQQTEDQVRTALTKHGGERSIADRLRNRKAFDLLVESAVVTEREWLEESKTESDVEATETEA